MIISIAFMGYLMITPVLALTNSQPGQNTTLESYTAFSSIKIDVLSSNAIRAVTGQFVTVRAMITNLMTNGTIRGIAYVSIVDTNSSQPIDLEDWSAQKGFYVPSIPPGQSILLEWNVRLVKSGSYTVVVLFDAEGDFSPPITSSRISLLVAPKVNLNPSNVLPVAFGVPILLIVGFAMINYRRGKKMGVYR
jgi:hypothetical protein